MWKLKKQKQLGIVVHEIFYVRGFNLLIQSFLETKSNCYVNLPIETTNALL